MAREASKLMLFASLPLVHFYTEVPFISNSFSYLMNTISKLPAVLKSTTQTAMANMTSLPITYKAAVFEKANVPLTLKDVPLKHPSAGEVLVKVIATGVCHSDAMV
jgi:hypothetical protein